MVMSIEYPQVKGQGDLSDDELQHLKQSAKTARHELADSLSTKLEEYEPGVSQSKVYSALEKVAKSRKSTRKHVPPPDSASS